MKPFMTGKSLSSLKRNPTVHVQGHAIMTLPIPLTLPSPTRGEGFQLSTNF